MRSLSYDRWKEEGGKREKKIGGEDYENDMDIDSDDDDYMCIFRRQKNTADAGTFLGRGKDREVGRNASTGMRKRRGPREKIIPSKRGTFFHIKTNKCNHTDTNRRREWEIVIGRN